MKTKGWREVFAFTFIQQIKTKSFIIGTLVITLIVALIAFMANFLPTLFLGDMMNDGGDDADDGMSIETLYLSNETDIPFEMAAAVQTLGVNVQSISAADVQTKVDSITDSTEKAVVSRIFMEEGMFSLDSRYSPEVSKGDCEVLTSMLISQIKAQYLVFSGLPEDRLLTALSGVASTVSCAGEEPTSFVQDMINAVVPMMSALVLFVFIFSYSQLVAQAIAIEKSSRIVEYLLTSIKPLALIIGKVLAMCCVSLMQFLIIGVGGGLGLVLSLPIGITSKIGEVTEAVASSAGAAGEGAGSDIDVAGVLNDIAKAFSNVDATTLIIMILTFVLGFLLYAGIAGVAGASVSKMEDLGPAIQPLSIIGVLGFYLAYFPQVTPEENVMGVVARYVPISSPFILPSDYMLGKIGLGEALISVAILLIADIAIMLLVAKVYENIILHTGSRLKLADMLKMSK